MTDEEHVYTLTNAELARLTSWLENIPIFPNGCPACGKEDWWVNDQILEIRTWTRGNLFASGRMSPHESLTCQNCKYTAFFNVVEMGIVKIERLYGKTGADV